MQGLEEIGGFFWKNGGFRGKWGFSGKMEGFLDLWGKIGVLVEKGGFRGFLVKKSGKSRKEPGI